MDRQAQPASLASQPRGRDPDVGDGVLALTTDQIAARYQGLGAVHLTHQVALFFPLFMLEGPNLHVASVRFLASASPGRGREYRVLELVAAAGSPTCFSAN